MEDVVKPFTAGSFVWNTASWDRRMTLSSNFSFVPNSDGTTSLPGYTAVCSQSAMRGFQAGTDTSYLFTSDNAYQVLYSKISHNVNIVMNTFPGTPPIGHVQGENGSVVFMSYDQTFRSVLIQITAIRSFYGTNSAIENLLPGYEEALRRRGIPPPPR